MVSCNYGILYTDVGDSFWVVHNGTVSQVWAGIDGDKVMCQDLGGTLQCCYSNDCHSFTCPGIVTNGDDQLLLIKTLRDAADELSSSGISASVDKDTVPDCTEDPESTASTVGTTSNASRKGVKLAAVLAIILLPLVLV